jgi:hypothetical protein
MTGDEGEKPMADSDEPLVDVDYTISVKKPRGGLGGEDVQTYLNRIASEINDSDSVLIVQADATDPRDGSWQDATLRINGGCGGKLGGDDDGDAGGDGDGDGDGDGG